MQVYARGYGNVILTEKCSSGIILVNQGNLWDQKINSNVKHVEMGLKK